VATDALCVESPAAPQLLRELGVQTHPWKSESNLSD
jgi:hypothetical protein